ncbi:MAG: phosphatidylglycerophosphatase A [Kiritimatiellia bacterium]
MSGMKRLLQRVAVFFATGFGTGFSPFASGTVGTLPAIPFVYFVWPLLDWPVQAVVATGLALLAIPICSAAERQFRTKDDGRIVADEYMTFPICMIGLPGNSLLMLAIAFVTCRLFDILKPEPADRLQAIKGGTGIVLDDVVASLYSLAVNHVIYHFVLK